MKIIKNNDYRFEGIELYYGDFYCPECKAKYTPRSDDLIVYSEVLNAFIQLHKHCKDIDNLKNQ